MISDGLVMELKMSEKFFLNTTECLQEEDSSFAPKEGMFSVTYMIAHVADTFDWFMDGMFSPDGFDMNFEDHHKRCSACKSVDDARKWFTEAVTRTVETIKSKSDEELMVPLPEGPVMGGAPDWRLSAQLPITRLTIGEAWLSMRAFSAVNQRCRMRTDIGECSNLTG